MTLTTEDDVGGGRYAVAADASNGPNRVFHYRNSFSWSFAESGLSVSPKSANSLKVDSPEGTAAIQCWQGSNPNESSFENL